MAAPSTCTTFITRRSGASAPLMRDPRRTTAGCTSPRGVRYFQIRAIFNDVNISVDQPMLIAKDQLRTKRIWKEFDTSNNTWLEVKNMNIKQL